MNVLWFHITGSSGSISQQDMCKLSIEDLRLLVGRVSSRIKPRSGHLRQSCWSLTRLSGSLERFNIPSRFIDVSHSTARRMPAEDFGSACLMWCNWFVLDKRFTVVFSKSTSIGLYNIVQAYCSLLRGDSVKPLTPRSAIKLADKSAGIIPDSLTAESIRARLAQFQITSSQVGWRPVLSALLKSALIKPKHRKTFRMPILNDNQQVKARRANERVTTHDLLMAYIWKVSGNRLYSFVMSI